MRKSAVAVSIAALVAALLLGLSPGGCSGPEPDANLSEAARRGHSVFSFICVQCHDLKNPFADRPTGPAIARSSRELIEAKVLRGEYPPGYTPKRPGAITMPKQPQLKDRIDDLYAFLQEAPDPSALKQQ